MKSGELPFYRFFAYQALSLFLPVIVREFEVIVSRIFLRRRVFEIRFVSEWNYLLDMVVRSESVYFQTLAAGKFGELFVLDLD